MPIPFLLGKSILSLATGAEAARTATSKLAMFAHEVDESTQTIARLAGGHGAAGQPPTSVVKDGVTQPVIEHPDLVWKHKKSPEWFVRKVVKARFETEKGTEYNWVQILGVVPGRRATKFVGRLANTPELFEGHIGDIVSIPLAHVVDVQAPSKKSARRKR